MIYLDNAATTLKKPPEVAQAVVRALETFGGAGRGAHEAALAAERCVFGARKQLARLLGAPSAARIAFSLNATEALNIAVEGLLAPGQHAVTTAASHNSVLRPLFRKQAQGAELTVVPIAADATLDYDAFEAAFQPNTRLAVVTHASNLTGTLYDIRRLAQICHAHGAVCVVDAAQTAGVVPLSLQDQELDAVCFTGHKSLYGPQGTGGIAVAEHLNLPPFKVGGGANSKMPQHPVEMPDSLEAGTLNAHGIAGLSAGVAYIEQRGVETCGETTCALAQRFRARVEAIENVTVYGNPAAPACGIVSLNINSLESIETATELATRYNICTRSGTHCAPLMHEAMGTAAQGMVRFSFSTMNTVEEADAAAAAIAELAEEAR